MRKVREITAEKENFRIEMQDSHFGIIKRDSIQPEPIGTIIIKAFRITGYDRDCDGSLMARLENISFDDLESTGWETKNIGLYPETSIVIDKNELKELYDKLEIKL